VATKGWLCMTPVHFEVMGLKTRLPKNCLALLAVYKTKKAAREIAGPRAVLLPVDVPTLDRKE
jgi:hypothetical protein